MRACYENCFKSDKKCRLPTVLVLMCSVGLDSRESVSARHREAAEREKESKRKKDRERERGRLVVWLCPSIR